MVKRGDVVLVSFPQGPNQLPKRRPALVVQCDRNNSRLSNTIVVMISSNTRLVAKEATQLLIDIGTADGSQSGLIRTSAVKCENIYTFQTSAIRTVIGSLSASSMCEVDECLRAALQLP